MSNLKSANPFEISLQQVTIEKFDGSDRMSLLPQFAEINIFQSVFSPLMRAELLVYDPIGLFVNYPITGEEIIRIEISQMSSGKVSKNSSGIFPFNRPLGLSDFDSAKTSKKMSFMISSITDIIPTDQARGSMYMINLISLEMFEVLRNNVSQFCQGPFDEDAKLIWDEYVYKKFQERERSRGQRIFKKFYNDDRYGKPRSSTEGLVIPNINPIEAMGLLGKYSIAEQNPDVFSNYTFFENFYGYFFVSIQALIQDQMLFANEMVNREKYLYTSNIETVRSEEQLNRLISNISINNRYDTIDKIVGGYYFSELYEVNAFQLRHFSSVSKLTEINTEGYLHKNKFNTNSFIEEAEQNILSQTLSEEIANHIKYEITFAADNEVEFRRDKYHSATKYLHALNQIDLQITIPPDLSHNAGEVIYCEIPEMHGFDQIKMDKYLSGFFFATEVKHTIGTGGRAATALRIQKDSLGNALEGFKYSNSSKLN